MPMKIRRSGRAAPSLLSQDYDGGFEVIVVNDGNDEATDSLLRELEATHKNLYHTFTPH